MRKKRIKRRYFIMSTAFIIVYFFVLIGIINVFNNAKETYVNTQYADISHQIDTTYLNYENYVKFVYNHMLEDTSIVTTLETAQTTTDNEKIILRDNLYDELLPVYEDIQDNHIKQLQVHLPSGESFLRMHASSLYGDNLLSIRPSINQVIASKTMVQGFEIGRTYTGYRYVFPVIKDNIYLGSVELSLSTTTLTQTLYALNPTSDIFFILKGASVIANTQPTYLDEYIQTPMSDDYYVELEFQQTFRLNRYFFNQTEYQSLFLAHSDNIDNLLQEEKNLTYAFTHNQTDYIMYFVSILDTNDDHVGYVIKVSDYSLLQELEFERTLAISLLTILTVSIIGFMIFIAKDKIKLETLSTKDTLTDISNRYYFRQVALIEFEKAKRYRSALSFIMFDIDFFKKVNDTYGHKTGDIILKELALLVNKNIRQVDLFARWGGEEFIILLPETENKNALVVAEKIRHLVESHTFSKNLQITISLGVASFNASMTSVEQIIDQADIALYEAKNSGRNRVESAKS